MKVVKLKEVANIYDGIHETPNYKPSGVRFVSVEDIKNLYHSNKYISILDYDKLYTIKPEYNDILMTRIGDIGTPAICNKEEPLAYYVSLALIKPININTDYLYFALQSQLFKKESYKRTIHVAFPKKINLSEIGECLIPLLENNIQTKIATFLNLYYKKIELQKKKIEQLERLSFDALFAHKYDGKTYKLEQILTEVNERTIQNNQYEVISSTKAGLYYQKDYFNREIASEDNTGYKILKLNQVVISPQNLWLGNINYNDKIDIGIVSPSYKIFNINEGLNKTFISNLLKSKRAMYDYMISSEQGASVVRRNLNMDLFNEIIFTIPDIQTQNHIAHQLNLIKNKINLEKQKLEAMEKYKQGLLQQLFI